MSREEQTWNGEGGSLRQKEPWVMIDGGEKAHESGGDHRHPSPPVRGWLISKWELGTDKPRASGQRSRLGYSEVFCTAREIMAGSLHDTPCTLPCYRSKQWNHTSDQSPQESSLLVRQRSHCMLHVRCTLQKGTKHPSVRETSIWFIFLTETIQGMCCSYTAESFRDITPTSFSLTDDSINVVVLNECQVMLRMIAAKLDLAEQLHLHKPTGFKKISHCYCYDCHQRYQQCLALLLILPASSTATTAATTALLVTTTINAKCYYCWDSFNVTIQPWFPKKWDAIKNKIELRITITCTFLLLLLIYCF